MKVRMLLIALFAFISFQMSAQTNDEVTLVVSADGATKEEATANALRLSRHMVHSFLLTLL